MAVKDTATLVIGAGNYFTNAVDTAIPADLADPNAGIVDPAPRWENIGHTSLEDIFSVTSEGGEATVIGTLQNKSLRTKYSSRSETMAVVLQQFDEAALKLYYGSNMVDINADGTLMGVPTDPEPTTCAFLAVFTDGATKFAFYAPKAEVYRGDDLSIADTESLAGLPLAVKPLQSGANTWTYAITPLV